MGGDESREGATGEPPIGGRSTRAVLVVDADPSVRSAACRALERAGIATASAADGREALRLVAGGAVRPEVLVTTIELPTMSGIELAARVLALRPGLQVVMMTSDPDRAVVARDHWPVVAHVLMKPLDDAELVSAVRFRPRSVLR